MIPSPGDLTYFIEVATAQNISRAAERLGISQPSLTVAIQRLEHSVGAPLLIRSKKGVVLTQSGKQLLIHARELMQRWETIKTSTLASTHDIQGHYTIGCHASVALYSLSGFMGDLLEDNPKLEIKLMHDLSRKVAERVIQTEVDLGIVVNPVQHPDLVIRKLCDDEVSFWVGKGSRKIQDFQSGEAVLICDPELLQTQDLQKKLKKSGLSYKRVLTTSNLEVVTELTAKGAGIGIIPGRVAATALGKGLARVPKAPVFRDEICLIYRIENKGVKSIQVMGNKILTHFNEK